MELEEALKVINEFIQEFRDEPVGLSIKGIRKEVEYQAIETLLNHITTQEKMIRGVLIYLDDHRIDDNICDEILNYGAKDCIHNGNCTECIKKYFEKKVEESE